MRGRSAPRWSEDLVASGVSGAANVLCSAADAVTEVAVGCITDGLAIDPCTIAKVLIGEVANGLCVAEQTVVVVLMGEVAALLRSDAVPSL